MTAEQRALGLRRLRLATLLQYALPGVPSVYYGDEAGVEGYKDPFNRRTYPWGSEDAALVDWYRRLGAVRRRCACLAEGEITPLYANGDALLFARRDGETELLCVVNRGESAATIPLPTAKEYTIAIGDGCVEQEALHLPPLSGAWLIR